jgi:N,N-dimethylformamidase beta subunit-like protein
MERTRKLVLILLLAALDASLIVASPTQALAAGATADSNPIVIENQQPGSAAWQLGGFVSDDATGQIKGYASATSVSQASSLTLSISVNPAQKYSIDIYRMGWYGGLGGRLLQHAGPLDGITQPSCPTDPTTGLIACNWAPSYTVSPTAAWTSGVYLAVLTNAHAYQNYLSFTVKDGRPAAFLYQQSVLTDQAYNNWPSDGATGKSLYTFNSSGANTVAGDPRAVKVSFDRPYTGDGSGLFLLWEAPLIRWLERSGYDLTYATDIDTHANGASLRAHKAFLSTGHDEYWTKEMFDAAEGARDAGVNLAFFGGDAVSVQARLEASGGGGPNRVVVSYKNAAIDPVQGPTTTVQFRQAPVNRPEQRLRGIMGTLSTVNFGSNVPYVVTNSSHWAYAGTGFNDGDTVPGIVGYEMDRYRPEFPGPTTTNLTLLSDSPFQPSSQTAPDHANSSIYQAPSGAWVFSSGTLSWSWALDPGSANADARIQRTTTNILDAFLVGAPVVHHLKVSAPATVTAGQAFSVSVTAENSQGNPVTSYGGTVHFSTSDASAGVQLPADSTLSNGQGTFSVTLAQAGPQTITVSDAANSLSTTVNLIVNAPAASIAFRGASTNDKAGASTSLALNVPAGVVSGDALYAVVVYEWGYVPTDPVGWTLVGEAVNTDNNNTRVLRRIASSEPASYSWSFNAANHVGGAMVAYSGVDPTTPEDVPAATKIGNSTTPISQSLTTVSDQAVLLSVYGSAGWGDAISAGPAGMNVRVSFGTNHSLGLADQVISPAGTTGKRSWTTSYATPWATLAIALRPANGAVPCTPEPGSIAFRAATQKDKAGKLTSLTLYVPAGVVNGDALYAVVIYENGAAYLPTDPPGWTLVAEAANSGNDNTRVLRRLASSEPASYTWTFANENHVGGAMVAYSGVDLATPEDVPAATGFGKSTMPTSPTLTTLTNNAVLLSIYGSAGWGGTTSTGPAGMNVRVSFGSEHSFGFADQVISPAAATGARKWTTSSSIPWASVAIAMRPAKPGAPCGGGGGET